MAMHERPDLEVCFLFLFTLLLPGAKLDGLVWVYGITSCAFQKHNQFFIALFGGWLLCILLFKATGWSQIMTPLFLS